MSLPLDHPHIKHARLDTTQIYAQVTIRAPQAIHAATHPAAANTPHGQRDGAGEAKRVAVSELLAALDAEGREEEPGRSPGAAT